MTEEGLINLKASITTFPFTDWIGSTTTATARGLSCSNDWGEKGKGGRLESGREGKGRMGEWVGGRENLTC